MTEAPVGRAPRRTADGLERGRKTGIDGAMPEPAPAPKPSADTPRLALRDLKSPLAGPFDLALAPGACAAIAGHSGSGKSLFLRMVADLDPNTGEVSLDGVSRATLSATDWRRTVPYVAARALAAACRSGAKCSATWSRHQPDSAAT